MRKAITISLPEEVESALEELAQARNTSRSEIVRDSIKEYVWRQRLQQARGRTMEKAQQRGFFNDEDVFESTS